MKDKALKHPRWVHIFPIIAVLISLFLPGSLSPAAQAIEVVIEEPELHPAFSTCPASYWYPFINDRGFTAYLTLNTNNSLHSTNYAEWHPQIPEAGYYRVEAFVAGHAPVTWCTGEGRTIDHDTLDARYSIYYARGVVKRSVSQYPLSNQWLYLGEYYFNAGQAGYVILNDLNGETEYSTTVSFSSMRFTYTRASRPDIYFPLAGHVEPGSGFPSDTGVIQAQGFDVCTLPSLSTMQTWWNQSPYRFYGLYLGGIQLPAQCAGATAAWVAAAHQQGWSFIPTWVGPQAPCSPWSQKMSSDPAVSYQQGRQEAQAASFKAASLGLTTDGLGGTIIYYDMEVYGGASQECRQAASSFMNGWVERLHELGNLAGGYGAHNSYVEDWAASAHVPDDIWAAAWYTSYYDPYATVHSIPWLDGLWINHQRIHQYAGDHHESWGGIGMGIDSDVADGVVAMPPAGQNSKPVVISSPAIQDSGWLSVNLGWLVSGNHLYWTTNRGISWSDISPASTQMAYFLPSGQVWVVANLDTIQPAIYYSSSWGANWDNHALSLPEDEWRVLQLQFTSPADGWMVLQKVTSQAFHQAILLKTRNAGLTWQTYELPVVGKISFTSQDEGWLFNDEQQQIFHTLNGGLSWQASELSGYPQEKANFPAGTIFSGWLAGDLGWSATSNGSCEGEKGTPGFACQVDNQLWQTLDGGSTWELILIPNTGMIKQ